MASHRTSSAGSWARLKTAAGGRKRFRPITGPGRQIWQQNLCGRSWRTGQHGMAPTAWASSAQRDLFARPLQLQGIPARRQAGAQAPRWAGAARSRQEQGAGTGRRRIDPTPCTGRSGWRCEGQPAPRGDRPVEFSSRLGHASRGRVTSPSQGRDGAPLGLRARRQLVKSQALRLQCRSGGRDSGQVGVSRSLSRWGPRLTSMNAAIERWQTFAGGMLAGRRSTVEIARADEQQAGRRRSRSCCACVRSRSMPSATSKCKPAVRYGAGDADRRRRSGGLGIRVT